MKKVFQTIIDTKRGNCMQAVVASLFDLPLEDVPNFIEISSTEDTNYFMVMRKFFAERGYNNLCCVNKTEDKDTELLKKIAKFDGGVNGYLYASVPSQTFENVFHSVVIDTDLNIVHDPNPNQLALNLKPEDVVDIQITKQLIIGKTGKLFTEEEWDLITEEERSANICKPIFI